MKRVGIIHGGVEIRQEEAIDNVEDAGGVTTTTSILTSTFNSRSSSVPSPIRQSQSGTVSIQPPGMRLLIVEF